MSLIKQYLKSVRAFYVNSGFDDPGLDLLIECGRDMQIKAVGGMTQKECFSNALIRAKLEKSEQYVEGRISILSGVIVLEHAWNTDCDFTIQREPADPYFGLVIPTNIAWAINQSKEFAMGGAGCLGTLRFYKEKKRQRYIDAIRQANQIVA